MKKYLVIFLLSLGFTATAQNTYVQFSGVVISADSLYPIPHASVMVRNSSHGTVGDIYGFFTIVAKESDTIDFKALGYKTAMYVIPKNLDEARYSIIEVLERDTIALPEVIIYPWPTREQFQTAFMNLDIVDDYGVLAKKNADRMVNSPVGYNVSDAQSSYNNSIGAQNTRIYNQGQIPMTNFMNPVAWAKFIDQWRSGKLKKKKE